jgi:hypothetical protein
MDNTHVAERNRTSKLTRRDPRQMVELARKYTTKAIMGIVRIAEDVHAPLAVRLRAWEILLERGYGKSPQAILVGNDSSLPEGVHAMSIVDRIMALRMAKEKGGEVLELENSEAVVVADEDVV